MELNVEARIAELAPKWSERIKEAAAAARNEAEFRPKVAALIEEFARTLRLMIHGWEERTLISGRADAVYNRLVVEYEPPRSLRPKNSYRANQHAMGQVKTYISELSRRERHKPDRLAGVVLDGSWFIFVRHKDGKWLEEEPIPVSPSSTARFLKLLASLSTELALTPENLVRDFGENAPVARRSVSTFYRALHQNDAPKVQTLFDQWKMQFSEVCDYEKASKLKLGDFARKFGIREREIDPFRFFFSLHTYYATFIKLLAAQVVHYYLMPEGAIDLKRAAALDGEQMRLFIQDVEEGGFFRKAGIGNFLEADFFAWYLEAWDAELFRAVQEIVAKLSEYSLLTLDADPDSTRDLLKKLYQHLMPKELRHNLGEYYTPDWLAQRLLDMVEGGSFTGNPNKRILDPACGSGTFLVLAIKRIREYARDHGLLESKVLEKILDNVVGFDLNPLAVIAARTNYLLAVGDLLQHRTGEITIPVYLCDSVMTPQEGEDLFGKGILRFNTAVGPFAVPKSLVRAQYIDRLADFLEEAVSLNLSRDQFVSKLCDVLPLMPEKDERDIQVVYELYEKLQNLQRQGINGIWAKIIKNAFAPLFVGEFDYVVGNPPWVNWESLPEEYRRSTKTLWEAYGLFPHGGMDTILGKGKKDISMLMTYVAMDKYLKPRGKLGFVITQSVFKTSGAGQGFRRFLLSGNASIRVVHVDDMVELQPFEGASNRTSVVVLQKGRPMSYPMPSYLYWRKTVKGKSIPVDGTLEDVLGMTKRMQFAAAPVSEDDPTSPWITGRPRALKAVKKVLGKSDYVAHAGCYTGGANAVYWIEIVAERPDGLVVVSNVTEGAKKKVESVQAVLEPDLLYPLLRGRDVQRWRAEPSAYIIMAQDPVKRRGIDEDKMKTRYPKTYQYLKRFERVLRERAAFKRYFTRRNRRGRIVETGPFYSMFDVGDYTFAPYKVVWRGEVALTLNSAVIKDSKSKIVVPDQTAYLVAFNDHRAAHFFCGILNSVPIRLIYALHKFKHVSMHFISHVNIPQFDSQNILHLHLAELSERAHEAAQKEDKEELRAIEDEIDKLAAQIWGLSDEEFEEIQQNLDEIEGDK